MASIPVFDISNPLGGLMDQAVSMGYVNEKRTTTKGAIASFNDNIEHAVSIKADIDPTLDGVSAVNINQMTGINLFDYASEDITDGKYISSTGSVSTDANWMISAPIDLTEGKTYIGIGLRTGGAATVGCNIYASDDSVVRTIQLAPNSNIYFTAQEGESYIKLSVRKTSDEYLTAKFEENITTPITLGSTVYGGSVSVSEEGEVELTETWDGVDLSSLTWTLDENTNRARTSDLSSVIAIPSGSSDIPQAIAENYDIVNYGGSLTSGKMTVYSDGSLIAYYDGETAPSGKFAYKLATATETDLTDIDPIETLVGENNIWADTGDIEVGYYYQLYQPI